MSHDILICDRVKITGGDYQGQRGVVAARLSNDMFGVELDGRPWIAPRNRVRWNAYLALMPRSHLALEKE